MKLEGVDPEHQSVYCVLTVAEVSFALSLFLKYSGGYGVSVMGEDATCRLLTLCQAQCLVFCVYYLV